MSRTAYPSDLTDGQWALIEPLIPPAKPGGRPREVYMREVVNGVLYLARAGCAWRMLPHDLPPMGTISDYYHPWRRAGVWQQIHDKLRGDVREAAGRQCEPSAAILDSQTHLRQLETKVRRNSRKKPIKMGVDFFASPNVVHGIEK